MIKRYGLSVSPCIVPLCMCTSFFLPKCVPKNFVDELETVVWYSFFLDSDSPLN
jgi:hypothetical protein